MILYESLNRAASAQKENLEMSNQSKSVEMSMDLHPNHGYKVCKIELESESVLIDVCVI